MWSIIPQTITIRGVEIEVDCKHCRFFPKIQEDGTIDFVPLSPRNQSWQVLVKNDRWDDTQRWTIKLGGNGKFTVIYNMMDETVPVRSRLSYYKPGNKETYKEKITVQNIDKGMCEARLRSTLGPRMGKFLDQVIDLLYSTANEGKKAA